MIVCLRRQHARAALGLAAVAPLAGAGVAILALAAGCGGDASGVASAKMPEGMRSESLDHEACDEGGRRVEVLDANNDGKADVKRVYDTSGHELCRISDLNHDGRPDMFEYYDASGQLRRREADYDDSGVVDAIDIFEGGHLASRQLDTTGQHRVDTWDTFDPATGKRIKRERDTTNDGRIDQWWTWSGDRVTIQFDKNGDGTPDPEATVIIGANGQPLEDAGAPTAPADAGAAADAAPAKLELPSATPQAAPELDAGLPAAQPQDAGAKDAATSPAPAETKSEKKPATKTAPASAAPASKPNKGKP